MLFVLCCTVLLLPTSFEFICVKNIQTECLETQIVVTVQ